MKAVVTGGGGFLGGAIVDALLAANAEITSIARGSYPGLAARGVSVVQADLADWRAESAVDQALDGADVVFHVAAKAGIWGPLADYERSNVEATIGIIAACRRTRVRKLVFTSTPSVVHAGGDIEGADESLPYARHATAYPRTKAIAERIVLAANGEAMATTALRPHLIWGPGDTQLVPRIIARAQAGRLRFPGDGQALIDSTYVDDAASAHLAAARALAPGSACAGRAYFISQGEPWPVMKLVNGILDAAGLPPERRTVPLGAAIAAGTVVEGAWRLLRRSDDPPMTRFLARQLATAHWFDTSAARRDFDWLPANTIEQGLRKLRASLAG